MKRHNARTGQSYTAKPRGLFSPGPQTVTRDGYYAAQRGAVVIKAKYPGTCRICRTYFDAGDQISWKTGWSAHVGCVTPE